MLNLVLLCICLSVDLAYGYAPTQATSVNLPAYTTSSNYVSSTMATPPPTMEEALLGENMEQISQPCHEFCKCQYSETGEVYQADCKNITNIEKLTSLQGSHLKLLKIDTCIIDNVTKIYTLNNLNNLEELSIKRCDNASILFENFKDFKKLRKLSVEESLVTDIRIDCAALSNMEILELSKTSLKEIKIFHGCENFMPLKELNLHGNQFSEFDWNQLMGFPNLEKLNLSQNYELTTMMTSADVKFMSFQSLDLNSNLKLRTVCNNLLHSLPNLKYLDVALTDLKSLPTYIFKLSKLEVLKIHNFTPKCNCEMVRLIQEHAVSNLFNHFENMLCEIPGTKARLSVMSSEIYQLLNCYGAEMTSFSNDTEVLVGSQIMLDCNSEGFPAPSVLWLTPRYELLRFKPDPEESCVPVEDEIILSDTIKDYSRWEHHFSILQNGSLLIDKFGWRDRGPYQCYVDNSFGNDSISVNIALNYEYRNVIYYWSLVYGFSTAGGFLALTLLAKLVHYLLWNYGCCYCCGRCHTVEPPKTKRLAAVVDSIENYRIQQLENLRNNYTAQSQRIRDNYTLQLQSMKDHYTNQTKGMRDASSDGYTSVKEQYCDNINKMRDYSNGQLTRCHENYIFQRQRLRKFSAANYLKIRETGKYTQKTLNRVIEHMPTLYVDLTSCRQGAPDWDADDMEEGPPQLEMADMTGVGESQSLYFTPAGTPLRDGPGGHVPYSDNPGGNPYSPVYSPSPVGKSRKSHKRMVSNLSNFLPFWWGMGQSDQHTPEDPGTTIAIVEHNHNRDEDSDIDGEHDAVSSLSSVKLVFKNGEAVEVNDSVSPKLVENGDALDVKETVLPNESEQEEIITTSVSQEDKISTVDQKDGETGQSV